MPFSARASPPGSRRRADRATWSTNRPTATTPAIVATMPRSVSNAVPDRLDRGGAADLAPQPVDGAVGGLAEVLGHGPERVPSCRVQQVPCAAGPRDRVDEVAGQPSALLPVADSDRSVAGMPPGAPERHRAAEPMRFSALAVFSVNTPETSSTTIRGSTGCQPEETSCAQPASTCTSRSDACWVAPSRPRAAQRRGEGTGLAGPLAVPGSSSET